MTTEHIQTRMHEMFHTKHGACKNFILDVGMEKEQKHGGYLYRGVARILEMGGHSRVKILTGSHTC